MLIASHLSLRLIFFLCSVVVSLLWGCAHYPHIPKVENQRGFEKTKIAPVNQDQDSQKSTTDSSRMKNKNYVVQPGDVLNVIVWDHDDLTREVQVSPDGEFNFPLIGRVDAHGITISELEMKIADKLSGRFIINPQLTIDVKEKPGECFFVYGEIRNPGRYDLLTGTTVLKAITTAGGVTEKAALKRTKIVRENGPEKKEIPVAMTDLVEPQDIIMVPESFF